MADFPQIYKARIAEDLVRNMGKYKLINKVIYETEKLFLEYGIGPQDRDKIRTVYASRCSLLCSYLSNIENYKLQLACEGIEDYDALYDTLRHHSDIQFSLQVLLREMVDDIFKAESQLSGDDFCNHYLYSLMKTVVYGILYKGDLLYEAKN